MRSAAVAEGDGEEDRERAEARLVARIRHGDREAFDELVDRYQTKVYNLALRLLGDSDEAADAAQEAFLRIYRGLQSFHGGSALTTWIYRIVHNLCLDEMKRKRRRPQLVEEAADADDDGAETLLDRLPDETSEPQARLLGDERQEAVRRAILRLRAHHRDVLVLYDLQGFTYNEIADVLHTNVGTVKSRLNRARLALARELEGERELFH
ncbi:MAG: sigma-70 family RNA polymerase sigma factor [Armatimonadetes bacterium]|nr:sigma-70 family RNA polymerase sigma factor [Armatimonadota bacterium]